MSALLVAIVCFGRGRWVRGFVEIKILDQNLKLLIYTAVSAVLSWRCMTCLRIFFVKLIEFLNF